ncbi:MAG: glutathione S-transferase family protein [Pseudomonadota bacterium]
MIILYDFKSEGVVGSPSPFVLKIETFLRLADLDFEKRHVALPTKAPKQKLPYIVDDGEVVCDSAFIIEHAKRKHGVDLDAWLSDAQLAVAHAARKMIEESTYWTAVYARWMDEANWPTTAKMFFRKFPIPLKWIAPGVARKKVGKTLEAQGYGRHSRDEIYHMGVQDVAALEGILADHQYLMGDKPAVVDASAFGLLAQLAYGTVSAPHADYVRNSATLMPYCDRIRARCFPE